MPPRFPDREQRPLRDDAEYLCPSCGERIVVPVDASAGERQDYVEDCPVCCRPHRLIVDWEPDGGCRVTVAAE